MWKNVFDDGYPPAGARVEIWYLAGVRDATWDGRAWVAADGEALDSFWISRWR